MMNDNENPCVKAGCGHTLDDHSLDLEHGCRLYCQHCACRRYAPKQDENDEDEGFTCDCKHKTSRGWKGKMPVALDGNSWPLDFAAKMLGCSEKDLRDLVRITGLEPAGTVKMASYRRSGRNPRAYDGSKLVLMWQAVNDLAENLHEDN